MKEFNIDNLLGTDSSENQEINNEPAPVIEKVSLNEINEEIENQEFEESLQAIVDYINLTDEEKEEVKDILLKRR